MKYMFAGILVLCLAVAACQPAAQPTPQPVVPQEPVAADPMDDGMMDDGMDDSMTDGAEEIESGLDKAFGETDANEIITINDVVCDADEARLAFRFRNTDSEKSWQLNQDVPFPPPKDLASIRVTINGYEANAQNGNYRNGELLFGPNEKFSDNCQGVEVLAPGEEVSCTVDSVPLRESTGYSGGVNEIYIDTPGPGGRVRFTC